MKIARMDDTCNIEKKSYVAQYVKMCIIHTVSVKFLPAASYLTKKYVQAIKYF